MRHSAERNIKMENLESRKLSREELKEASGGVTYNDEYRAYFIPWTSLQKC